MQREESTWESRKPSKRPPGKRWWQLGQWHTRTQQCTKVQCCFIQPKEQEISNRKTREAKKHWETRNIEANAVWMGLKSKKRVKQGSKASWRIAWKGWRGQPERFCLQNTIESSSPHELEKPELRRDFFRRALGQNQNDCCCSAIQEDYSIEKRSFTCKEIGRSSLWRSCSADRGWVGRNQRRSRTKRKGLRLSQGTCAFRRFWPFLKLKALKWV